MSDSASHQQAERGGRAAAADGDMPGFIAIARVVRPQGRKGEVLAEMLTDFPTRFQDLQRVFLDGPGHNPQAATLEHTWLHKGKVVLKLAGIGSIDDAETLRGRLVLVPAEERVALSDGRYYVSELIGCRVVVETGETSKPLGTVTEVERTAGADLLHVADGSREVLIPFAKSICKLIDLGSRLIVIEPPDDLLDLNRE
ncbi:MAG TPA: ribosome maturation factor RimM [Terriglobia bacterium]|nr:ribosome maturation factor RimM [Terriglobia bacterium]